MNNWKKRCEELKLRLNQRTELDVANNAKLIAIFEYIKKKLESLENSKCEAHDEYRYHELGAILYTYKLLLAKFFPWPGEEFPEDATDIEIMQRIVDKENKQQML